MEAKEENYKEKETIKVDNKLADETETEAEDRYRVGHDESERASKLNIGASKLAASPAVPQRGWRNHMSRTSTYIIEMEDMRSVRFRSFFNLDVKHPRSSTTL